MNNRTDRTDGMAAQQQFRKLIVDCKRVSFTETSFTKEEATDNLKKLNMVRYEECLYGVKKEFGEDWEETTTKFDIIDSFYGIDFLINYKGYIFAIDVTSNPNEVNDKLTKMNSLKQVYNNLFLDSEYNTIDQAIVLLWDVQIPYGKMNQTQKENLCNQLHNILSTAINIKQYMIAKLV